MPTHLQIIALDRIAYEDDVDIVVLPGEEGQLGVLPRHARIVTLLEPGEGADAEIRRGDLTGHQRWLRADRPGQRDNSVRRGGVRGRHRHGTRPRRRAAARRSASATLAARRTWRWRVRNPPCCAQWRASGWQSESRRVGAGRLPEVSSGRSRWGSYESVS